MTCTFRLVTVDGAPADPPSFTTGLVPVRLGRERCPILREVAPRLTGDEGDQHSSGSARGLLSLLPQLRRAALQLRGDLVHERDRHGYEDEQDDCDLHDVMVAS
jgi:hypothetical protein